MDRRRIAAQFANAIFDVLAEEAGRERAAEILSKTVIRLAREAGRAFAGQTPEQQDKKAHDDPADLLVYAEILALWQQDGALTIDHKVKERDRLEFDVKRCRYVEFYREFSIAELDHALSCSRDGDFGTGFNPAIRLP